MNLKLKTMFPEVIQSYDWDSIGPSCFPNICYFSPINFHQFKDFIMINAILGPPSYKVQTQDMAQTNLKQV